MDRPSSAPGAHQRQQFAGACDLLDQMAAHMEAARILADVVPQADRLGRIVLEQHADVACGPRRSSEARKAPGITTSRL